MGGWWFGRGRGREGDGEGWEGEMGVIGFGLVTRRGGWDYGRRNDSCRLNDFSFLFFLEGLSVGGVDEVMMMRSMRKTDGHGLRVVDVYDTPRDGRFSSLSPSLRYLPFVVSFVFRRRGLLAVVNPASILSSLGSTGLGLFLSRHGAPESFVWRGREWLYHRFVVACWSSVCVRERGRRAFAGERFFRAGWFAFLLALFGRMR